MAVLFFENALPKLMISLLSKNIRAFISALVIGNVCLGQRALPPHDPSDSRVPAVTFENLSGSERFWPYWVALTKEQPGATVPLGLTGVLLRIESDNRAVIDFGRDGIHFVPVIDTDLVERAERIRNGTEKKDAPNFTYLIGARLVQSSAETIVPLPFEAACGKTTYLCVFIPTEQNLIEQITGEMKDLAIPNEIMPILFPIGETHDNLVFARLKKAKCTWSFVYNHLAETYTHSLLPGGLSAPAIVMVSNEGRIIFSAAWSTSAIADLQEKLNLGFTHGKINRAIVPR